MTDVAGRRRPTHPGEILSADYLAPRGISIAALATTLRMDREHVGDIVGGRCRIEPHVAILLADALGTSARFWLNLQDGWDQRSSNDR
ncbi:HigA family addiction module antitoxin [Azospirillum sp.]|uniref:HigA family addiction module antitoxin n=1 Tax=Azospirillum sp. TaxID=34012 RepID=UPI002D36B187|nr:HigA family addiction module antitoxin [Azospirillum sp.]HYD71337.1 HigA family addiction module antitoxin [Azospirillum sp.]